MNHPYSSADSADERFSTPRARARGGGYLSSDNEGFYTPGRHPNSARSVNSSGEFDPGSSRSKYVTPRGFSSHESDDHLDDGFYSARRSGFEASPRSHSEGYHMYHGAYESKMAPISHATREYATARGAPHGLPPLSSPPSHQNQAHYTTQRPEPIESISLQPYNRGPQYFEQHQPYQQPAQMQQGGHAGYAPYTAPAMQSSNYQHQAPFQQSPSYQQPGIRGIEEKTFGGFPPQDPPHQLHHRELGDVSDIFSLARHNRYNEVEAMLERGVPVNTQDKYGNTILSVACQNGLKRLAKLALRRGADINWKNMRGNTPLHFAYRYGYGDTLGAYLITKGADPSLRNDDGCTCYEASSKK